MERPNAFLLNGPSASRVTFQQFLQSFPLPTSGLHFRFRKEDKEFGYVWQDIREPGEIVPNNQSCITVKILRLGDVTALKRRSRLKLKMSHSAIGPHGSGAVAAARAAASSSSGSGSGNPTARKQGLRVGTASRSSGDNDDEHASYSPMASPVGGSPVLSSSGSAKQQGGPSQQSSLIGGSGKSSESAPAAQTAPQDIFFGDDVEGDASSGGVDTFAQKPITATPGKKHVTVNAYVPRDDDIDDSEPDPASTASGGDGSSGGAKDVPLMDMMGDDNPAPSSGGGTGGSGGGDGAEESEALKFKHELDRRQKQAAEDMDAARLRLQDAVNNWATNNGEKRNVRTLLTTMHTLVNWPNSNWKPLTLSDVIEAKKVKIHYRKAMMVVHPDKASHLPPDGQYVSRRVFEGINEAYHEFEKKENP